MDLVINLIGLLNEIFFISSPVGAYLIVFLGKLRGGHSPSLWGLVDGQGANIVVRLLAFAALELLHTSDSSWDHEPGLC